MKKHILSVICVIVCVVLLLFTACAGEAPQSASSAPAAQSASAPATQSTSAPVAQSTSASSGSVSDPDEFITILDQAGNEVQVPAGASRLVTMALPLPSVFVLMGAPTDYIVGMHPGSSSAIENSVMAAMYPEFLDVPNSFVEGYDTNIEELLKLHPDVVLYWADFTNQYDAIVEAGLPGVGVTTQDGGDVISTLESWLEIMGQMFPEYAGNANKVIEYGRSVQEEMREQISGIAEEDKPRTMILFNHNADEMSVSGSNDYGGYWIESTGGVNVAAALEGSPHVNMEEIYTWNPEIIVISSLTETMPEDLYNNTVSGQDWSNVDAVINKRVYKNPLGVFHWYAPCGDAPLMINWMAQIQHPQLFTYDMAEQVRSYYKEFYGYDLTDEQIEGILTANPEAARGASWHYTD